MNRFLVVLIFIISSLAVHAQDFFADEQNKDTIVKSFYEQKNHGTICYSNGFPANWYAVSALVHYNKEKFSPYIEFRENASLADTYTLIREKSNTSSDTTSKKTTKLNYRYYNISVGMAAAARKNLLIYANVGIRWQKSLPNNTIPNGYYLVPKENQLTLVYGGGVLFMVPYGITLQLGVDLSKFTIIPGLGYTF
jgi:hypothetical protein